MKVLCSVYCVLWSLPALNIGPVAARNPMGALDGAASDVTAVLSDTILVIDDPLSAFNDSLNAPSATLSISLAIVDAANSLVPVTVYVTPASNRRLRLLGLMAV